MIQSRLSRPDELGLRIDSPMREESRPAQGSTTSVSHPHGLPTPSSALSTPHELTSEEQTIKIKYNMPGKSPTSGFTAVNGELHRHASFRPDDSLQRPQDGRDILPEQHAGIQKHHDRRADDRSAAESGGPDSPSTHKRKREDSDKDAMSPRTREDQALPAENELAKRRTVATDTPADPTSTTTTAPERIAVPVTSGSVRARTATGPYEREPSPIFMKDRGAPPPPPRPEIAAGLAESLQRELATAQDNQQYMPPATHNSQQQMSSTVQDNCQNALPGQKSASPADESYDHQQSPTYESENGQHGDGDDSTGKKRKRNFSNRTKTGCHTCRARKKKCDESKPICNNCQRGGFDCGGYGAKPPGGGKVSAARPLTAIKPAYEPSHGPSQFSISPYHDNRPRQPQPQPQYDPSGYGPPPPHRSDPHCLPPVHHYNHPPIPPPMEYRPRDPYATQYPETQQHYGDRYLPHGLPPPPPPPPTEYGALAPYRVYPEPNHASHASHPGHPSHPHHPNHPSHPNHLHSPPAPPAPPSLPRYAPIDQYHGPPGPPTSISSKESGISSLSSSQRSRPGLVYRAGEKIARSKMITGEPCNYFTDRALINERSSCKEVLERYNDADKTTSGVHIDQKGVIFSQLVNPKERGDYGISWDGPIGSIGDRVVVQAPFSCEYGYNMHFGDEAMIMRNCHFQDAATISIGSHVTIGPGCNFLTLVSPTESGPHGQHSAGAIKIEDGCTIGGNVTILPFRTIGKGATVIAGSVVTKDVKPGSKVAGNPAKLLRDDDEVVEKENAKVLKDMQNGTWRRF